MDVEQINLAIDKLKPGLNKYISIMDKVNNVDVSKNTDFQRAFNGFYRIRQRKQEFYEKYYTFMESSKANSPTFENTLLYLYNEFGRIEPSFSSKLVATINPNLPIWDSVVLKNLNLRPPQYYSKNRVEKTIDIYNKIIEWYDNFMVTSQGKKIIQLFKETYPESNITDIKKIDLVLWQIR